jgi:hypothetical protein
VEEALVDLWWGDDSRAGEYAEQLKGALKHSARAVADREWATVFCLNTLPNSNSRTMLSYPDNNSPLHHPSVYSLARLAEDVGADLRIIPPQLVSLSIYRRFVELPEEAQQMSNQKMKNKVLIVTFYNN